MDDGEPPHIRPDQQALPPGNLLVWRFDCAYRYGRGLHGLNVMRQIEKEWLLEEVERSTPRGASTSIHIQFPESDWKNNLRV